MKCAREAAKQAEGNGDHKEAARWRKLEQVWRSRYLSAVW